MDNINRVVVSGRLTRDAEMRYASSGTAILKFGIASNKWQGKGKDDYVNFFDFVMFGKRAESISPHMTKGKQVIVDGSLSQNRWETDDGQKRSKIEIKVDNIELVGKKDSPDVAPDF